MLLQGISEGLASAVISGTFNYRDWRERAIVTMGYYTVVLLVLTSIQFMSNGLKPLEFVYGALIEATFFIRWIGSYLSGHWAIRQLPDDTLRIKIAQPPISKKY